MDCASKVEHFQTLNYKQTFQGTNVLFTGSKGRVCKFSLVNCDPFCLFSFVVIFWITVTVCQGLDFRGRLLLKSAVTKILIIKKICYCKSGTFPLQEMVTVLLWSLGHSEWANQEKNSPNDFL